MITITINDDGPHRKALLYFSAKYMTKKDRFNVLSKRHRRSRDNESYDDIITIPYGESEIDYKGFVFKIVYEKIGDPVGTDNSAVFYIDLRVYIDEEKFPNYEEKIKEFFIDAKDYYNNKILDRSHDTEKVTCWIFDDYWDDIYKRKKRPLNTVHLNKCTDEVYEDMKRFLSKETEELYEKLGVPYKRNYLFEGYPGTGKTSLIFSLASELDMDVSILNFKPDIDDVKFTRALLRIPDNSILVLEDIDVLFNENRKKNDENKNMITLSGLLNTLDGLAHQEKQIIIMTTNFKCTLDNALQRPGRIDYVLHFDFANKKQIKAMYTKFLPKQIDRFEDFYSEVSHLDITTATLQQFLFRNMYEENIIDHVDKLNTLVNEIDYTGKKMNLYS